MAIYHLSTRIRSNVPASSLLYDLCIYRMDTDRNKIPLVDVKQQPFQESYQTQIHMTEDIDEPESIICIMEVTLYQKSMLHTTCVTPEPFTKMYTLGEFASDKAWSAVKRENPCYFVTYGMTKPANEGENIVSIKITRHERPFIAKNYPIGDPQDPFERANIEADLKDRFYQRTYPSQSGASLCGPAAFFYCLQMDRPDVYAQGVSELWRYGKTKIGALEIIPGEGCHHPSGVFYNNITGLDWMTLAGLRDSENALFSFDSLDSPLAGITLWSTLTKWFEKAGYEKVFSNVGITQAGIQGINDLNKHFEKGYKIISLVNDSLLQGSLSLHSTIPNHWIVWDGVVTQNEKGHANLRLFSWGQVASQIKPNKDINFFINRFFGGVAFNPLN
jgi:hypothetical protein